jgi:hypothetical protein
MSSLCYETFRNKLVSDLYNVRGAITTDEKLYVLSSACGLKEMPWLRNQCAKRYHLAGLEDHYVQTLPPEFFY